jgi:hypothetical protein
MKRLLFPAATGGVPHLPYPAALSIATAFDAVIHIQLYQPRTDDHVVDPMSWGLTSFASPGGMVAEEVARARRGRGKARGA